MANNNYNFDGGAYGNCLSIIFSSSSVYNNGSMILLDILDKSNWGSFKEMLYSLRSSNNINIKNNYLRLQSQYSIGMDVEIQVIAYILRIILC